MKNKFKLVIRDEDYCDPLPSYVDLKTGEVKEGYPPSIVDSSAYEPLEKLVARLARGEDVGRSFVPSFEVGAGVDPREAVSSFDPTRARGVDLADLVNLEREAREVLEAEEEAKKQVKEPKGKVKSPAGDPGEVVASPEPDASLLASAPKGAPVKGAPAGDK